MKMFTPKEQAAHCRELANRLKRQPKSAEYNHGAFTCGTAHCALGWAAVYKIGGLKIPNNPETRSIRLSPDAADHVFGSDAWGDIFNGSRPGPRRGEPRDPKALSIHRLREQAKLLLRAAQ